MSIAANKSLFMFNFLSCFCLCSTTFNAIIQFELEKISLDVYRENGAIIYFNAKMLFLRNNEGSKKGRKLNLNKWLNINKQFIETFAFSLARLMTCDYSLIVRNIIWIMKADHSGIYCNHGWIYLLIVMIEATACDYPMKNMKLLLHKRQL